MTTVAVVTPSLPERGKLLAQAIASVNNQTRKPDAHVIAIDHGHEGPGILINRMILATDCEWISILADDDVYHRDHLEKLLAASKYADVVYSWGKLTGSQERARNQYRGPWDPVRFRARQDTGIRGNFMVRRVIWKQVGGWRDEMVEDWNFLRRCLDDEANFVCVPEETWTYRYHGGNVSLMLEKLGRGEQPPSLYHMRKYLEQATAEAA